MNPLLTSALYYASLGYRVFPCVSGGKQPATPNGYKDATTDKDVIRRWWENNTYNIGIPTDGLLVVDIDGSDNRWLADDPRKLAELASGPLSLTPRGGRHHLFRQPDGIHLRNTTGRLAPKVDTRASGGYIVVPPSIIDGKMYQWAEGYELVPLDKLPYPPEWLVSALTETPKPTPSDQSSDIIPEGSRNSTLTSIAGSMRHIGLTVDEIYAALLKINETRCSPPLKESEVYSIARSIGQYKPNNVAVALASNGGMTIGEIVELDDKDDSDVEPVEYKDPGTIPIELLRVPGFVSEVMDYTMETAPYPNQVAAFCGAMALLSALTGRKVCDRGNLRTNLYILNLAYSAAGKNKPREVNYSILKAVGMAKNVGGKFASAEGIEDMLAREPVLLFQSDEIDAMLQSINKTKDGRYEQIMATLMTIYSSSQSSYITRTKAGKNLTIIENPHLVLFGTAIPNHYYSALSERMLTNGFFSRMMIFDSEKRPEGQEPTIQPIPLSVLNKAKYWADLNVEYEADGNRIINPITYNYDTNAQKLTTDLRKAADMEYSRCEDKSDPVGTAVWGRVWEHSRKLALLYAVSEGSNFITEKAVKWAGEVAFHQARRMLYMAGIYSVENQFHADCAKFKELLRKAKNGVMTRSALLRRLKMDVSSFNKLVATMEERGEIQEVLVRNGRGRPPRGYRLLSS